MIDAHSLSAESAIGRRYPISEAQLEIWLSSKQSEQANCAYNEITSLIIRGSFQIDAFEQALQAVIARHESLRSLISVDGDEVFVLEHVSISTQFHDHRSLSSSDQIRLRSETILELADTPFDLCDGPLLKVVAIQTGDSEYRVILCAHHLIMDGWSFAVLCRDLGHFYDSIVADAPVTLPSAPRYEDYVRAMRLHQQSPAGLAEQEFWVSQFKESLPVLELPTQKPRPAVRTYAADRYDHKLSKELVAAVRSCGAKSSCSLFVTVFTAFQSYLARLTQQSDICIGIPTAGQLAMEMPDLLGHCVSVVPLRSQVENCQSFRERLQSVRSDVLNALDHQTYSYGQLLRKIAPPRDSSRPPLLSVSMNVDPEMDTSEFGFSGLDVDVVVEPRTCENFEWFINGVITSEQTIELQVQYNSDLFEREYIACYFQGFEAFLEAIVTAPDQPLTEATILSTEWERKVICDWNATDRPACSYTSLVDAWQSNLDGVNADRVAIQFGDQTWTYRQADQVINALCLGLMDRGVEPGDRCGICLERSGDMFFAVMAILKCRASYVALDPQYPADRLQDIAVQADLKTVLTTHKQGQLLDRFDCPAWFLDDFDVGKRVNVGDAGIPERQVNDVAYVLFTSGSTGRPKGVVVRDQTVLNLTDWMQNQFELSADDAVLAVVSLSFDMSVGELFLPMMVGGRLVIADDDRTRDGFRLADSIEHHNIRLMQATPQTYRLLLAADWKGKEDLTIVCAGEPFPADLVDPLLSRSGGVWNLYGPTETTVYSTAQQLRDSKQAITIGHPIANTCIYVVDSTGMPVPPGVEGEMWIAGAGVTDGYLGRPDLTSERFVDHRWFDPFADVGNWRCYRTGDVVRYLIDGQIDYRRRNDSQVKVRGYRIELTEIEEVIRRASQYVDQVVAMVWDRPSNAESSSHDPVLVAYLTGPTSPQQTKSLAESLRQHLPHYMVPSQLIVLPHFPLTSNGKIDRKQLPLPERNQVVGSPLKKPDSVRPNLPTSPTERELAKLWKDALQFDSVELTDNFFDLGGHSLLVMQMITKIETQFGYRLSPQRFLIQTLEMMAAEIDGSQIQPVESASSDASGAVVSEQEPALSQVGRYSRWKGFWSD